MYRIIGIDGKHYGPVTGEQLREWIAAGRANGDTLVQPEGSTEWKPLSSFAEFAGDVAAKGISPAGPGTFPSVPPTLAAPPGANAEAMAAEILARGYRIEIGSCLSRSWDLCMKNFWLLVGAGAVSYAIVSAVGLLAGVCFGGYFWLLLKLIRGERAEFGDCFAGFSLAFLQLFLAGLVTGILESIGILLCLIPGIYLMVAWTFVLPLVIDKKLEFWPAMELSRKVVNQHWWIVFGLVLVCYLTLILGMVACCVGLFVALPVAFGAMAYAYEDIFGSKPTPAA
ncbi:MAG: DUF4339 domain-containing protein [Verrucomicrobia bacterium]|nr:DUF4339 domain-containing protein [Verrucomicrobiota bacterium]